MIESQVTIQFLSKRQKKKNGDLAWDGFSKAKAYWMFAYNPDHLATVTAFRYKDESTIEN